MNSKPIMIYKCSKCNQAYYDKSIADKCCTEEEKKYYCKHCGKEIKVYQSFCEECYEYNRFMKANKIKLESYKYDFIYDYLSERYFNIDSMYDYYECDDLEIPQYIYACKPLKYNLEIDNAIEYSLEEHYEDANEDLIDVDELYDFIKEWNKKQTIVSYEYDPNTVILL